MHLLEHVRQIWTELRDPGGLLLAIAAILVIALIARLVLRAALRRLRNRAKRSATRWDDAVLEALSGPLGLLVWVMAADAGLDAAGTPARYLAVVRSLGLLACAVWFARGAISRGEALLLASPQVAGRELPSSTVHTGARVASLLAWVVASFVALQALGFDLTAVLALSGIGGVALGFASRDVIANFFGGLMVHTTRPFAIGDWIRSPDRDIEGTVEDIGWYMTRIRTFSQRPLYVPNAVFAGIALENPSRMTHRRISETIGLRYDDFAALEPIVTDIRQMLLDHPDLVTRSGSSLVAFDKFAASSLDVIVYCLTTTREWAEFQRVKQDVLLQIGRIVERHGAHIAFPTSTVQVAGPVIVQ